MPISKAPRETISSLETGVNLRLVYTSYISTISTSLVRSSATDETTKKRELNKLILMFSSLRIFAICALIPYEETKNMRSFSPCLRSCC